MYVRFVVSQIDAESGQPLGVFQAIHGLCYHGRLSSREQQQDEEIGRWFDKHLEKPTRFTAAKAPYYRKKNRAISWFKDSAREHIKRIRELVVILERHGYVVEMLTTDRVGYVVYEDEFQIVAEPFRGEVN